VGIELRICTALLLAIAIGCTLGTQLARADPAQPAAADNSPQDELDSGQIEIAGRMASDHFAANPLDKDDAILAGRVALWSNRLGDAQRWFQVALDIDPKDTEIELLLGEVYRREDDFADAATMFAAGGMQNWVRVYQALAGKQAYRIDGSGDETRLNFTQTAPLPVVQVAVDGGTPVSFLIDTGAREVILDPDFAKSAGIVPLGTQTGWVAGGTLEQAQVGVADSLGLGGFMVRNLPVQLLPTKSYAAVDGGKPIEGVIGLDLLYYFLATIDYPRGELILRRNPAAIDVEFAQDSDNGNAVSMPFWLVGDHDIITWSTVNGGKPQLLLIDAVPGSGFPAQIESNFGIRVDGLIPQAFLRRYAVTIDFQRMLIVLTPPSPKPVYGDLWPIWPPPPEAWGGRGFGHGGHR
jgi:hypothetical protein